MTCLSEISRSMATAEFHFHGFRYVELSGIPAGVTSTKDWITGVVLQTDLPTNDRVCPTGGTVVGDTTGENALESHRDCELSGAECRDELLRADSLVNASAAT